MKLFTNLDAAKIADVQIKSYKMLDTGRGIAWSCTVYFKGDKLGKVSNEGNGGMTHIEFSPVTQKQIMDGLKVAGYELELNIGGSTIEEPDTVESWIEFAVGQMGDELNELKSFKRRAKTHTFVHKHSSPAFASYKAVYTPATREQLRKHLGDDLIIFLNDKIMSY